MPDPIDVRHITCLHRTSHALPFMLARVTQRFTPLTRLFMTSAAAKWSPSSVPYPAARRSEASTTYKSAARGEVVVPEPYDWLETPPSQSEETAAWTRAQAAYTSAYLEGCPHKSVLQERLRANWDYARASAPSHKGDGRYYYAYNAGLAPQSQIYRATREQLAEAERVQSRAGPVGELFFDTNVLSDDGTVALTTLAFSHSGAYLAYGLSKSGSDWFNVYVRPTSAPLVSAEHDGRLDDILEHVKFSSIAWTHDDAGFFYQRYPAVAHADKGTETDANRDAQLYYHRLGTPQEADVLVIDKDAELPSSMWTAEVTDDGAWLLVENSKDTDTKQRYYVASLADGVSSEMRWIPIATTFEYTMAYLANDGTRFYFMTNKDAPNYRIVAVDVDPSTAQVVPHVTQLRGGAAAFHEVLPADPVAILTAATVVDTDKLLVVYSRDVKDELWLYDLRTGKQRERLLPELVGTIGQIAARREDREAFVSSVSFANPGRIERVSFEGGAPAVTTYSTTHVAGICADDYESTQVFVTSRDGTRVPMFLTYPRDMPIDGTAPALVYFYGGFNIPLTPVFSPSMMTWVASYRGVLAFVNARGGGEYGDKWHEAGALTHKQNVFDDVLAACRWLHENKFARKGAITINGGSNGGLGVAAVANQCTEEHGIGAAIADVGVHDMLKVSTARGLC